MTDQQSPDGSELTSEQEATVRRLLAEARHDAAIPDVVAARLDRVLAQQPHPRAEGGAVAVDLTARRRRRNAGRLLLAAAAIVVGGTAVGQVVGGSGDAGNDASTSAEDASLRSESPPTQDEAGGTQFQADGAAPEAASASPFRFDEKLPVELSHQDFVRDVRKLARDRQHALNELRDAAQSQRDLLDDVGDFDCPPAAYGEGTLLPAYYDQRPAVLAFRPPLGSNQVAELLQCGTAQKLRSVTLSP